MGLHLGFVSVESPFGPPGVGGIASYLRALIPEYLRLGHRVTLVADAREHGAPPALSGLRVAHFRLPGQHWRAGKIPFVGGFLSHPLRELEWSIAFQRMAARAFRDDPPDVLECCDAGALLLSRWRRAPVVLRLHGSDYFQRRSLGGSLPWGLRLGHALQRLARRGAAGLSAPSRFHAEEVARDLKIDPDSIFAVPNPLPAELLAGPAADPGEESAAPMVLFAHRLTPHKGVATLLEAAKRVHRDFPRTRFVLAGPWQMDASPERAGVVRRDEPVEGTVIWLGPLSWERTIERYRSAHLAVAPSHHETFGISVAEAMAVGLPVVGARSSALDEVVEDGITGLLAPPGDAGALAAALLRLLRDPELRRRMGRAGRARALKEFAPERIAGRNLEFYGRLARGRSPGAQAVEDHG